jgi:phytoene synthase
MHLLSRAMLVTAKRNWSKRLIPAHQSIQYLIEAVIKVPHQPHYGGSIHARLVWVVNLLERVEMRRREQAKAPVEPQKIAA